MHHKIKYSSETFSPIQAFSTKWPYVAFSGLNKNMLIILNAFDRNVIHRVEMPDNPDVISQTFITETNDLYVITNKSNKYRLQYIDLDSSNRRENSNTQADSFIVHSVIEYESEDVSS